MKTKYKCLYEITGCIEDVATFLVPIADLPQQRTWVGLTDDEIDFIRKRYRAEFFALKEVEAKLKEKNGAAQQADTSETKGGA